MSPAVLPATTDTGTVPDPIGTPVPGGGWTPPRRRLARVAALRSRWREQPAWYRQAVLTCVAVAVVVAAWLWFAHRWLFWLTAVLAVLAAVLAVQRRHRAAAHRARVAAVWAGIAAAVGHTDSNGFPDVRQHLWLHVPRPGRRLPEQTPAGRLAVFVLSRGVLPSWPGVRVRGHVLVPGRDADLPPRDGQLALWAHRALMRRAVAGCVIQGHVVRHYAFKPKLAETISGVLNRVYPGADLRVSIDVTRQVWTASPKPRPPETASLADLEIEELVEQHGSATRLLAGLTASGPVWLDIDGETPHVGMSMGTGAGKSSLFRLLGAQMLYHGAEQIDIIDPKRISLDAFRGVPGVRIWRDVELQIKAVEDFHAEMTRRYKILEDNPEEVFPPRFLFLEEMNSWTDLVKIWWRQNREESDPKNPPVLDTLAFCFYQGRQAGMHIVAAFQQMNARAAGGSALRDQFGGIFLARFSPNVWKFLTGDLRPVRRASKHPGRAVLVVHGDVTDIQLVFASPADARAFALRRGKPETVTDSDAGRASAAGSWGSPGRPVLDINPDSVTVSDGGARRVTLPEAVAAGTIPMTIDAARKARQRDPEFPRGKGRGRNQTYTEEELRVWFANRAKPEK